MSSQPSKKQKTSSSSAAQHVAVKTEADSSLRAEGEPVTSANKSAPVDKTVPAAAAAVAEEHEEEEEIEEQSHSDIHDAGVTKVIAQFKSLEGETTGPQLELPYNITKEQLHILLNQLLENDEKLPYSFYLNEDEIVDGLKEIIEAQKASTENVLSIIYQPQAIFRVRAVTRCTTTIPGHTEAVLHVQFSGDGRSLATGSGDTTVRLWDVNTETPKFTCKGHKNWVQALAWSPNGRLVASGSTDTEIRLWDAETGKLVGKPLSGHKKYISSLAWEPIHQNFHCTKLASGSKDGDIRIWDVVRRCCILTLSGHTQGVTALKWGGQGLIYSASQDRTIKVWESNTGKLIRTLEGHAHWVNCLSLNTDYAMRTNAWDEKGNRPDEEKEIIAKAKEKYEKALSVGEKKELLVSGSDDFTLILWDPVNNKKPILRMTGHQQPINYVCFSPDGRYIASASFDKSVKLWHGHNGKFITTFRAHVQAVYQCCWSADSRLLVSSSKDSTMKVWDIAKRKMMMDLPGHADEVFACDWSPDGERVASGGKDQVVKIWRQ